MNVTSYTLAQQKKLLESTGSQPFFRALSLLSRSHNELKQLAMHRWETIGYPQYGDASFHYSKQRLTRETKEEAADLVFYQMLYDLRDKGLLDE